MLLQPPAPGGKGDCSLNGRKNIQIHGGTVRHLGLVIIVVAIIWVGATKYFEKGNKYVSYFDESVQGLQQDSIVKYRGWMPAGSKRSGWRRIIGSSPWS